MRISRAWCGFICHSGYFFLCVISYRHAACKACKHIRWCSCCCCIIGLPITSGSFRVADCTPWQECLETVLLKCHIGFRGETHSSSCRQAEGQEGPCCCKRDDNVDLWRLRQTMRLAHWSVYPSHVAPMTWGSVDLDDTIRYDTRCYFNVRSKADISQLNLLHGTDN